MRHPTEGALRRLLDEPAGVADADRQHIVDCQQCLHGLAASRADAALVGAALADEDTAEVDVAAAWRRLATAAAPSRLGPAEGRQRAGRPRALLRRPATAVLAVALVLTGASTAAANDWLPIFSTKRITPVSFSTADLLALPDLRAYGDLTASGEPDVHEVADAAAAAAQSGLDVSQVADLPSGISGKSVYQVGQKVTATFTFSAERAARSADFAGETLPPPPAGLDGSSVRLSAGPGVAQIWESAAGVPGLVVASAVAPTAESTGVSFDVLRDYLLSLPGMSDEVAEQLRTFAGDGSTLPLPVPRDQVSTTAESVNGVPATVLETRDRSFAAVVWVDDGLVHVVAGSLDDDEVLAVARELR